MEVRNERELRGRAQRIVDQARRYTQPELDKLVTPIVLLLRARYEGQPKKLERLISKVRGKQQAGRQYDLKTPKDHARGAIIMRRWKQAAWAIRLLEREGLRGRGVHRRAA